MFSRGHKVAPQDFLMIRGLTTNELNCTYKNVFNESSHATREKRL